MLAGSNLKFFCEFRKASLEAVFQMESQGHNDIFSCAHLDKNPLGLKWPSPKICVANVLYLGDPVSLSNFSTIANQILGAAAHPTHSVPPPINVLNLPLMDHFCCCLAINETFGPDLVFMAVFQLSWLI